MDEGSYPARRRLPASCSLRRRCRVRRILTGTAAGFGLAAALSLTSAFGSDLTGSDLQTGQTPPPQQAKKEKSDGGCGNHGTAVTFVDTPSEAARKAKKEEKLVFVLHVSGLFEDPKLT